jgi:hypothetical protein
MALNICPNALELAGLQQQYSDVRGGMRSHNASLLSPGPPPAKRWRSLAWCVALQQLGLPAANLRLLRRIMYEVLFMRWVFLH